MAHWCDGLEFSCLIRYFSSGGTCTTVDVMLDVLLFKWLDKGTLHSSVSEDKGSHPTLDATGRELVWATARNTRSRFD